MNITITNLHIVNTTNKRQANVLRDIEKALEGGASKFGLAEITFADFAKHLAIKGMSKNNVVAFCKACNYIHDNLEPYRPYVEYGYFTRRPLKNIHGNAVKYQTFLTPKGAVWLGNIIQAENEL